MGRRQFVAAVLSFPQARAVERVVADAITGLELDLATPGVDGDGPTRRRKAHDLRALQHADAELLAILREDDSPDTGQEGTTTP